MPGRRATTILDILLPIAFVSGVGFASVEPQLAAIPKCDLAAAVLNLSPFNRKALQFELDTIQASRGDDTPLRFGIPISHQTRHYNFPELQ